jgi:acyl-coenzyme A thioesterase PaaI-like protein
VPTDDPTLEATPHPTPGPEPTRRRAVEELAAAVRRLSDVAVETAIDAPEIIDVAATLDALAERLGAARDTTPYSGLTVDTPAAVPAEGAPFYPTPQTPMPLNPIIGACSPVRPDVELHFEDGEVRGTAIMTKRFVGPPGFAHGGISAMLADQLVAVSSVAIGVRCVTKSLHVRYRRPLPLDQPLTLVGRCARDGDALTASCTVSVGDEVAVEGTAELVEYDRLARRAQSPEQSQP